MPTLSLLKGNQYIGTGNGDHEFSWIYLDRNSLAIAGTIIRYSHGFPACTRDGPDRGLKESGRVNPPEMRVLDCKEFRCTQYMGEIHGKHFTATNSLSSSGETRGETDLAMATVKSEPI